MRDLEIFLFGMITYTIFEFVSALIFAIRKHTKD